MEFPFQFIKNLLINIYRRRINFNEILSEDKTSRRSRRLAQKKNNFCVNLRNQRETILLILSNNILPPIV